MSNIESKNVTRWFLQPSSWISLSAAFVSIGTFYLVYGNPGELKITLPTEVGLRLAHCKIDVCNIELLAPVVFTNTGAQRKYRQLIAVSAEIRHGKEQTLFRWKSEWKFVGKLDFNKMYPGKGEPDVTDYIVYVGRATPFVIGGGKSISKLLKFESPHINLVLQKNINLLINVVTERGVSEVTQHYICRQTISENKFDWCEASKLSVSGG